MRVLVVEDDQEMAEATALGLRRQSKAVDVTLDGPSGFEHTVTNVYDVIVLDRDLPGMHGDDICTQLVAAGCRSRVLMPTAPSCGPVTWSSTPRSAIDSAAKSGYRI